MGKWRRREFLMRQEATPGTAITDLGSADALVKLRDESTVDPEIERFQLEEVQASSAHSPDLMALETFGAEVATVLRGPGDLVTVAAQDILLESAMFQRTALKKIGVTAVSGTFTDGMTITGGTSAATGTVFRAVSGGSELWYHVLTGTFQDAETITGTGGTPPTATSTSAPTDLGAVYRLGDSDFGGGDPLHHMTCEFNIDGKMFRGAGCLSDLSFNFENKRPAIMRNTITGVLDQAGTEKALAAPSAYPEVSGGQPIFVGIQFLIGSWQPTDIVAMTLDVPNQVTLRQDAQQADGVLYADYDRGEVILRFTPAMPLNATYDLYTQLRAGTVSAAKWQVGSTDGKRWDFYADAVQAIAAKPTNRNGISVVDIELKCTGTPTQPEVVIHQR